MSYSWNWIFLKKIWEIRDLPIEDKITIFKTLAIWRIICNLGGLKDTDIFYKITSL